MVNQTPDEGSLSRATIGSEGSLFADPHKPRAGRMLITCRGRGGAQTPFINATRRGQF